MHLGIRWFVDPNRDCYHIWEWTMAIFCQLQLIQQF